MHGRTRVALLVMLIACLFPAGARAAQIPPGVYDVTFTGGTLKLGLLPELPLPATESFPLTIGTSQVNGQVPGFTLPAQPINQSLGIGTLTGSYVVAVQTLNITLDPTTGDATVDSGVYVTLDLTLSTGLGTTSDTCHVGTAESPVALHLTTADGSAWDPATNAFRLVDNKFTLPALTCDGPLSGLAGLAGLLGGTTPGSNNLTLDGTMIRRPDPTPTSGGGGGGGGGTPQGTTQTPAGGDQTPATTTPTGTTRQCKVPKLRGKSVRTRKRLKKVKAQLKRAGCRLGKVRKVKSKKRKGTIVKQKPAPGKTRPAGTRVTLTVSRGSR